MDEKKNLADAVSSGLREGCRDMRQFVMDNIAPGRRRSVALRELESFEMWARKAAYRGDWDDE